VSFSHSLEAGFHSGHTKKRAQPTAETGGGFVNFLRSLEAGFHSGHTKKRAQPASETEDTSSCVRILSKPGSVS